MECISAIARLFLIAYNVFADSNGLAYGEITVIRQDISF